MTNHEVPCAGCKTIVDTGDYSPNDGPFYCVDCMRTRDDICPVCPDCASPELDDLGDSWYCRHCDFWFDVPCWDQRYRRKDRSVQS